MDSNIGLVFLAAFIIPWSLNTRGSSTVLCKKGCELLARGACRQVYEKLWHCFCKSHQGNTTQSRQSFHEPRNDNMTHSSWRNSWGLAVFAKEFVMAGSLLERVREGWSLVCCSRSHSQSSQTLHDCLLYAKLCEKFTNTSRGSTREACKQFTNTLRGFTHEACKQFINTSRDFTHEAHKHFATSCCSRSFAKSLQLFFVNYRN